MKNFEQFINEDGKHHTVVLPALSDDYINSLSKASISFESFEIKVGKRVRELVQEHLGMDENVLPLHMKDFDPINNYLYPETFNENGTADEQRKWTLIKTGMEGVIDSYVDVSKSFMSFRFLSSSNRKHLDGYYSNPLNIERDMPRSSLVHMLGDESFVKNLVMAMGKDKVDTIVNRYRGAIRLNRYNI